MFRLNNYLHRDYSQIIDCIWKFTYTALKCPPKKVQPICELSLYEIIIVKPRSSHALKSRQILCINLATERVKLLLMQQTKKFRKYAYTIASACEIWTNLTLKVWCCKTWFMKPKIDSSTATAWFSSKVQISRSWTNMLI